MVIALDDGQKAKAAIPYSFKEAGANSFAKGKGEHDEQTYSIRKNVEASKERC